MARIRLRGLGRLNDLTYEQFWELDLGPDDGRPSAFKSPFTRRAAWFAHREQLMESGNPGTRPWGFYEYEIGEHPPVGYMEQVKFLRKRGLLSPEEDAEIRANERIRA